MSGQRGPGSAIDFLEIGAFDQTVYGVTHVIGSCEI
jgi:hypothetical protein